MDTFDAIFPRIPKEEVIMLLSDIEISILRNALQEYISTRAAKLGREYLEKADAADLRLEIIIASHISNALDSYPN